VRELRCAIYARFSSDRQSPTSISDQIRKCRDYAARQPSWFVLDQHIYSDEAISGASTEREGLQKLLAAAGAPSRPFDCILIDDTSRLTRKLADALNLYERLTFAGVRLVAVSQGVDSESSQAELLIGVHGLIDAVYWRELGQKTHRGMQGLALRGFHTGGRCFGYKSVKLKDSSARLEIDRAEAEIINRIYRLYAESGYSMKRIAHTLNTEGVLAPQPQKGRFSRSWCVSSVRHILLNTRYAGKTTWNTRRKIRVPGTGKRVFRPRPRTEWVISETPHLRIVTDELATAVRRRLQTVKQMFGKDGGGLAAGPKRYLFSGLLKCGVCGGSIALVCGRGRHGADRYGCSLHHQRGDSVCRNRLLVRRDELEESLLRGLSESVLRTEVIDYAVARMEDALRKRFEELDVELEQLRQRKQQIEAEIARLIQAIADGQGSQSLTAAIGERERELRSITDKLLEPRPGSLRSTLDELRTFAVARLTDIRKLIAHPESIDQARAALAEHFGAFTLEPVTLAGKTTYLAHGKVDFFGDGAMARTDGAGGQNRTGYARLFRAALYQ
jgi:site-specific DNA recombinase